MKLARLANTPSALIDFYQEGLEALGAICERTWHDRLHLVAEGAAARPWDPQGALLETEIYFVPPDDAAPRQADQEVFPGCPLTFKLAEELRPRPLSLERGVVQPFEPPKPPAPDVLEKLWLAQMPGSSRWRLVGAPAADWHFSLVVLARCEIQAIDQHWTLHRVAMSLSDGRRDESLATSLDFLDFARSPDEIRWPSLDFESWQPWLKQAFEQELESDLLEIRARQQEYLRRELERVDSYFEHYESELMERHRRSRAEGARMKAEERLTAAKGEHARRRQDQIHRHEIRVMAHFDTLLLLAEPAWRATVSLLQRGESKTLSALFVPRARRWIAEDRPHPNSDAPA
jgi:hypothetical protein